MKKLIAILPFVSLGLALAGCPAFPGVCDYGICDDGGLPDGSGPDVNAPDAIGPEGGADAEPPPGCTTPNEPLKNPEKCLVDAFGAFVSPTGDDGNPGTKARPFRSIGKALATTSLRIVICEGEFAGSVDIGRTAELYSGVACDFAKAGGKAKIVASKPGYAVKVSKANGTILADLELVGMNAAAPSESSVGLFVSESTGVRVLRSKVEAGDGAEAAAKKDGLFTYPADAMLKGANAADNGVGFSDDTPGAGGSTGACPGGGSSAGGKGGLPGAQGDDGNPRPPGGAKGGASVDCSAVAGAGTQGNNGGDRAGATVRASVSAEGIVGGKGLDGESGTIGGGGGGGYGTGGAGGGGGAGGCGGQGGFGGGAGGSSIAVLSFASEVSVEGTELVSKSARAGAQGGSGQVGQGAGARGNGSNMACNGGNGAKGGDGGFGGGGAGGISAGLAWLNGTEPKKDAQTKITRPTGAAPVGGEGGGGTATKGVDGVHADVFEVK